jgi:hypothetical protein
MDATRKLGKLRWKWEIQNETGRGQPFVDRQIGPDSEREERKI